MSKTLRIDDFVKNADGTVDVHVTVGRPPLPLAPQGLVLNFNSLADVANAMAEAEESMSDRQMVMILLSQRVDATGDTQLANAANFKNRAFTLDVSATAGTVGFS